MTSVSESGVYPRQIGGLAARVFDTASTSIGAGPSNRPAASAASDAAAFRRPAAVMRDRRHIADRGDRKPDGLQGSQSRLSARTRALHLDVEGAHAMFHGFAPASSAATCAAY